MSFHVSSVSFLGFIASPSHIKMDPEKKFIRNFSAMAAPLHALTSPKVTFQWGPEAEGPFQQLKKLFTTAPVLTILEPKLQFIVEVDASNEGLSSAERNYDVGNRELLARAIKVALEEWRHWLDGAEQPFIVWTDHKNLEYLKPGSQNAKPDALSRLYEPETAAKEPEPILPPDRVVGAVSWQIENDVQWARQGEPVPEGCPRNQLFVPEALRSQVIHWAHTSLLTCRPGVKKTVFVVKQRFWWSSLAKDVAEGPQFISGFWKEFCQLLSATFSLSSGYHPESNSQTERLNQELETCLRCLVAQNQMTWSDHLTWVEYAHNSLPTAATGLSPFQVVHGYQPPLFPINEEEVTVPSAHALARTVQENLGCCTADAQGQARMKTAVDRHWSPAPVYTPGQNVWLSTKDLPLHVHTKKLAP
ncbi:hypothetical protein L3Q82_025780, partial [Scortum barcoo]